MTFNTIAQAEAALVVEGYKRDVQRALWVNQDGKTAKVVRNGNYFAIERK